MKPYKNVTVVKVDLDRKSFTKQGLHMNNLGKEKTALKIANVVTKIFLKQEEIISLCWKNEYEVSVSDSSNEDTTILQDSKAVNRSILLPTLRLRHTHNHDSQTSSIHQLRTGHATLTTDPTANPYPPHAKPELICSALHHTTIQLSHGKPLVNIAKSCKLPCSLYLLIE